MTKHILNTSEPLGPMSRGVLHFYIQASAPLHVSKGELKVFAQHVRNPGRLGNGACEGCFR